MKKTCCILMFLIITSILGCQKEPVQKIMSEKYRNFTETCMGRHVFQFPAAFSMTPKVFGNFSANIAASEDPVISVLIEKRKMTQQDFKNHIYLRRNDLQQSAILASVILRTEKALTSSATLFRVQRNDEAYYSELHFMLGENLVVARLDSYQDTFNDADDRVARFMSDFSIIGQSEANGFCLGALTIQGNYGVENGSFRLRDDAGNTFRVDIDTFATEDSTTLLQRMAGPDSLLNKFHIQHTVLRSGERNVAGMRAQEWLGSTNLGKNGDEKAFKFVLETMPHKGSRTTPGIKMTFDSAEKREDGTAFKTNLSDAEAMAIWDKVVNSIRPAD